LQVLIDEYGLLNAKEVILSGGSAGGIAAFFWADYVKSVLNPETKYAVMPDSSYIFNFLNVQTQTLIPE
jgi:hypothetical protein